MNPHLLNLVHHYHDAFARLEGLQLRLPSDELGALPFHQVQDGGQAHPPPRSTHVREDAQTHVAVAPALRVKQMTGLAPQRAHASRALVVGAGSE